MATKKGSKLNGSVDKFSASLRDMIKEATAEAVAPVQDALLDEMVAMEDRLAKRIDTVAENTQSQLVEVNKRLGKVEKHL